MSSYCCSLIWVKLNAISGLNAEKACWPSAVAILMCKKYFFLHFMVGHYLRLHTTQFALLGLGGRGEEIAPITFILFCFLFHILYGRKLFETVLKIRV